MSALRVEAKNWISRKLVLHEKNSSMYKNTFEHQYGFKPQTSIIKSVSIFCE